MSKGHPMNKFLFLSGCHPVADLQKRFLCISNLLNACCLNNQAESVVCRKSSLVNVEIKRKLCSSKKNDLHKVLILAISGGLQTAEAHSSC